jgi:hypothetical protein
MDEQVARNVVLVRAIETMDRKQEILSADDRKYASRSAKELAEWQAADSKSPVTADHFLQQRSEQILKRLAERTPAFRSFLRRGARWPALALGVPLLALLLGAGVDRISDPHRVDLLSAPLLAIIGWNLLVYLILLVWPEEAAGECCRNAPHQCRPRGAATQTALGLVRRAGRIPGRMDPTLRQAHERAFFPNLALGGGDVCGRRGALAPRARPAHAVRRRLGEYLPRRAAGARYPVAAVCAGDLVIPGAGIFCGGH